MGVCECVRENIFATITYEIMNRFIIIHGTPTKKKRSCSMRSSVLPYLLLFHPRNVVTNDHFVSLKALLLKAIVLRFFALFLFVIFILEIGEKENGNMLRELLKGMADLTVIFPFKRSFLIGAKVEHNRISAF